MRTWVDWGPHLSYWVEDSKPDPLVDWPDDWEVCGVPNLDPLANRDEHRRHGNTTLAWAMYNVADVVGELQRICSFLEQMPPSELEKWLALQDRLLTFCAADQEMDAADMNIRGFEIPGPFIQRVRNLRLRLMIGIHPTTDVKFGFSY
jgi:hypothetical protein